MTSDDACTAGGGGVIGIDADKANAADGPEATVASSAAGKGSDAGGDIEAEAGGGDNSVIGGAERDTGRATDGGWEYADDGIISLPSGEEDGGGPEAEAGWPVPWITTGSGSSGLADGRPVPSIITGAGEGDIS